MFNSAFFSLVWAITPEALQNMQDILERRALLGKIAPNAQFANSEKNNTFIMEAATGEKKKGGKRYKSQVISVAGPMFKKAGMIEQASGLRGTDEVVRMISEAEADPDISSIVLNIDSPGGAVDGTETLAKAVREAKKPVVAYVDGMAASAAYWVASQADEIVMAETTSIVGSIGTIYQYRKQWVDAKGNTLAPVSYIRADGAEDKARPANGSGEDLTEEDIALAKQTLNPINQVFQSAVKAGRKGVKPEAMTGKIYTAEQAIALGLADKVGTLQDAVNDSIKIKSQYTTMNPEEFSAVLADYRTQIEELKGAKAEFSAAFAELKEQNQLLAEEVKNFQAQAQELTETKEKLQASEAKVAELSALLDKTPSGTAKTISPSADVHAGNGKPAHWGNPWNREVEKTFGTLEIKK